jgi:hypothetical protein
MATFIDYLCGVEMLIARRAALEQVIPDSRHSRRSPSCAAFAASTPRFSVSPRGGYPGETSQPLARQRPTCRGAISKGSLGLDVSGR